MTVRQTAHMDWKELGTAPRDRPPYATLGSSGGAPIPSANLGKRATSQMGHDDLFTPPRLSAGYWLGKPTFCRDTRQWARRAETGHSRAPQKPAASRASLWIAPAVRAREAQEDRLLEVPHLPVPVETAGTVSPSAGRPVATCPRPRDRHQPHARRGEQPRREAVPSRPGSSPLPGFVGLGRPSVDNMSPIAVYLRPRPEEVPPPIPSRFALWFRRGPGPER